MGRLAKQSSIPTQAKGLATSSKPQIVIDNKKVELATEKRSKLELKATELVAERRQLKALNRAKDEFISLAAHQLRTPATGVKQYLGMVLEGYAGKLPDRQRTMLQKAYASNDRQLHILNDLLLVAKIDAGKLRINSHKHNLCRLIKDVAAEQQMTFQQRNQTLMLDLPPRLEAHFDAKYIRMVLENLINNASKYSPSGKNIIVRANKKAHQVIFLVEDEGIGISQKDQKKLYQKFSRLGNNSSSNIDSNGLGLYWSKKIIDLHGGSMELYSRLRKGSTFTVKLPF